VPSLLGITGAAAPDWHQVPEAVRSATTSLHRPLVLVDHSGGGALLPAIAATVSDDVAALVFVDSFLPPASGTLALAPPAFRAQLRALAVHGVLPPWSSWFGPEAMRDLVPDARLRTALEAEMPRLPLSYLEASVPVPHGWDRHGCAYLLLSTEPYGQSAEESRRRGWPVAEIPGGEHLAIATDPVPVTNALVDLVDELTERTAVPGSHR
jgi:pimeloyl-ACP methyl ester carboxylesterase